MLEAIEESKRKIGDILHSIARVTNTHDPECDCDFDRLPGTLEDLRNPKQDCQSHITELAVKAERLTKAIEILAPVFERANYELTEESAAELLGRAEEFDPTTRMAVVPHPEDVAAAPEGQPEDATPATEVPTV